MSEVDLLLESIEQLQETILNYKIKMLGANVETFITRLEAVLASAVQSQTTNIKNVLEYVDMALQNRDYLLLADLLEYELKPILTQR